MLMMDPRIKEALSGLCRQRPYGDAGALLLDTTCLYSSGRLVQVVVRGAPLATVSDGAAAFDELLAAGVEAEVATRALKAAARRWGLRFEEGEIFSPASAPEELAAFVPLVATASSDGFAHGLAARHRPTQPIRDRLQGLIDMDFREKFSRREIQGSYQTHVFDFVNSHDQRLLIVDSVLPDASSIHAKLATHLDVSQHLGARAMQVIVYSEDDNWDDSKLGLMSLAGRAELVPLARAPAMLSEKLAA